MLAESDTKFDFFPDSEKLDYLGIWNKPNKLLSKIRLDYFSFIFQQTNLMRNFNIYENIAITKMLQNTTEVQCKRSTTDILRNVGLDEFLTMNNGAWNKQSKVFDKAHEASGGQQQRIAFARAMVSDYEILFCDEPTGNLDPKTADKLMSYLREEVKKKGGSTAIIVSHDLKLAAKYGDRIVKIFKQIDDDEHFGFINSDSVFTKENAQWQNNGVSYADMEIIKKLEEEGNETV
jgi:ABC-type lipoprotein export system ATPase subunit